MVSVQIRKSVFLLIMTKDIAYNPFSVIYFLLNADTYYPDIVPKYNLKKVLILFSD